MKPFLALAIVLALAVAMIATAEAKGGGGGGGGKGEDKEEVAKKAAEKAEAEKRRDAVKEALDAKDKSGDGSLSLDEYVAGEANAEDAAKKFIQFDKNKSRKLEKSEIANALGL